MNTQSKVTREAGEKLNMIIKIHNAMVNFSHGPFTKDVIHTYRSKESQTHL